jgi:hypothetical protein
MTITEFLEARIAEDEADVRRHFCEPGFEVRILAECAAKRAIIELAKEVAVIDDALMVESGGWLWGTSEKILVALAVAYRGHKEYLEAWG